MGIAVKRERVLRVTADRGGAATAWAEDRLVAEEPVAIRLGGGAAGAGNGGRGNGAGAGERLTTLAVTMRTPGDDLDLALGYCVSEGLVGAADEVALARACPSDDAVDVVLAESVLLPADAIGVASRLTTTTSACGLCGSASVEAIRRVARWNVADDPVPVSAATLAGLPDALRSAQRVFDRTGGLHAAGLFTADGQLTVVREDVGRHNAVDKVVGFALRENWLPLRGHVLLVSGRASFELAQKAVMAGIPVLAAVSAPSAQAVALARETGLTLVGFLRGGSMNVYAGTERVLTGQPIVSGMS